jgi:mono/diheme cytochrome c family protein
MKKTMTVAAIILTALVFVLANNAMAQKKAWDVPVGYKNMKSANPSDVATAKQLYGQYCKSCHGAAGLGDGPKAANLTTPMDSFKTPAFKAELDGVVYFQSFVGRNEMPNFEKKITNEGDRWAVVKYVKNF